MMTSHILTNGRILDSASGTDTLAELLIVDGKIALIGTGLKAHAAQATIIDCSGCYITPGLIDIHVHFREPGQEAKEDDCHGDPRRRLRAGFTTVCCMPNTTPLAAG